MQVSPAEVLQQWLITQGLLVNPTLSPGPSDWPSVIGPLPAQPNSPDNFVSMNDTGADQKGRPMRGAPGRTEYPTVQFMIRSAVYPTGYQQGAAIQALLDQIGIAPIEGGIGPVSITLNSVDYVIRRVMISTPVTKIGQEQQNLRELFTINAQVKLDVNDNTVGGGYFGPYF